jgi:hypothetical protein
MNSKVDKKTNFRDSPPYKSPKGVTFYSFNKIEKGGRLFTLVRYTSSSNKCLFFFGRK